MRALAALLAFLVAAAAQAEGTAMRRAAEALLAGQRFDDRLAEAAAERAAADLRPPADFRGTAEYRRAMAMVLTRRALLEAWSKTA